MRYFVGIHSWRQKLYNSNLLTGNDEGFAPRFSIVNKGLSLIALII